MDQPERRTTSPGLMPVGLHVAGKAEALARSYAEPLLRTMHMLMAFIMEVERTRLDPPVLYTSRDLEACTIVVRWAVSPLVGKTTNWRAGCGRSARPVRREGAAAAAPYPYQMSMILF